MIDQLDLFGARTSDPPTSHQAAQDAACGAPNLRARVYAILDSAGVRGMTDDELQQALPDEHPGSVSKRRTDLVKLGKVYDTGRTRPTRRGSQAIIWRTT